MTGKRNAVLVGPFLGELFWEFGRFVPYVIWKKLHQYKDTADFIIFTRPDRFDMYGKYANVFVPLRIKGDGTTYIQNCFRLDSFSPVLYNEINKVFLSQFSERYNIIETIKPNISKSAFADKNQYPKDKVDFSYNPREENCNLFNSLVKDNKPIVVLAPRFRKGMKRNWPHWNNFYDLIDSSGLSKDFNFIICGKYPDYISDNKDRFLDISKVDYTENTSMVGLTMEILKRAVLTVGSQSAIPNMSLLFGTEVLEWGNQKYLHTIEYNIFDTKVTFIEDQTFTFDPREILIEMTKILSTKKETK